MSNLTATARNLNATETSQLVNPIISGVLQTFQIMLECNPKRTKLELNSQVTLKHPLSAIISISGEQLNGNLIFNVSETLALNILRQLIGDKHQEITDQVKDAVGEIANMIAGAAKSELESLDLHMGTPLMICGTNLDIHFDAHTQQVIHLSFDSPLGEFALEFGT